MIEFVFEWGQMRYIGVYTNIFGTKVASDMVPSFINTFQVLTRLFDFGFL